MKVHSEQTLKKLLELRQTGHSINEIVALLKLPKSTVWHHVQKVKVLKEYSKVLKAKQGASQTRAIEEWKRSRAKAIQEIGSVSHRDRLIIAACLYWAEGSKKDFCIVNTDPELIRVFVTCLKEFNVPQGDIQYGIRVYEDLDVSLAKKFWAGVVGVSTGAISSVNVIKGRKHGKLQYGLIRIRVKKGKEFFKLIHSLREIIVSKI